MRKQEDKSNEFVSDSVKSKPFICQRRQRIVIGVILVAIASGAIVILFLFSNQREMQSQREKRFAAQIRVVGGGVDIQRPWPDGTELLRSLPFLGRLRTDRIIELDVARVDWTNKAVPPDVLSEIGAFDRLEVLTLNNCHQVTDAGLEHLEGLGRLYLLWLDNTDVTDAGFIHLQGLLKMRDLRLNDTQITDAGIKRLNHLSHLDFLHLNHTQVTDAGLEHLKGVTSLGSLWLDGTQVTDVGLEHLKGLKRLRRIHLNETSTTAAGRAMLRKALPKCKILPEP